MLLHVAACALNLGVHENVHGRERVLYKVSGWFVPPRVLYRFRISGFGFVLTCTVACGAFFSCIYVMNCCVCNALVRVWVWRSPRDHGLVHCFVNFQFFSFFFTYACGTVRRTMDLLIGQNTNFLFLFTFVYGPWMSNKNHFHFFLLFLVRETMDYFRAVLDKNELSERSLNLTEDVRLLGF